MAKIVTNQLSLSSVRRFVEAVTSGEDRVYAWIGDQTSSNTSPDVTGSVFDTSVGSYRSMITGARVSPNLITPVIREVQYQSNVVYAQYDDQDPALSTKDFYVVVDDTDVFKCLYNAGGSPSTVAPNLSDVDDTDQAYFTSDGYQWRYMYSFSPTSNNTISGFVPVSTDANVRSLAVAGAIDVINVDDEGLGYDNYLSGTFTANDLRINGNTLVYALSTASSSGSNGFYSNCYLTITGGSGSGQFREITTFVSNSSGRFVVLDSEFVVPPTNGSDWDINPIVRIKGSGKQTSNAFARAIVDPVGNVVSRVDVLSRGSGYDYASATVEANSIVGVETSASVRVINSPPGGHGYDAESELYSTRVLMSLAFSNSSLFPAGGSFKRIGLLENPLFSNTVVGFSSISGQMTPEETAYVVRTRRLPGVVTVSSSSNAVTGDADATFSDSLRPGDYVYLSSSTDQQVALVASVTNSSHLVLSSNSQWSSSNAALYLAELGTSMVVGETLTSNTTRVESLSGDLLTGDVVVGSTSGVRGVVATTSRGGVTKNTSTFVQLTKLTGNVVSGTFQSNEVVYQGPSASNASATALLHTTSNGFVYVSNVVGVINTSASLFGSNSGAILNMTDKYDPEVEFGSGRILFVENINKVQRTSGQSELLKFLLEF